MKKYDIDNENDNHWQTSTDVMAALLLIMLLINMILILYILKIPEEIHLDDVLGSETESSLDDTFDGWDGWDNAEGDTFTTETTYYWNDGGGGGGDGGGDETTEPTETTAPTLPTLPYEDGVGTEKAAVYVMVVDDETEKTIKEAGVQFQLFTSAKASQVSLYTYYPLTTEYKLFETREEGVFYLPEKVRLEQYYLHELTEPYGYDAAEDVYFDITEAREWDDPFVIKIPLHPASNTIRLHTIDADTLLPVTGGVYDVIAAEPIVTLDGTMRYTMGQIVDRIVLDEEGYGESIPLYLGRYTLQQAVIPQYYAADSRSLEITLEKKLAGEEPVYEISCRKTAITLSVIDELYENVPIREAQFSLSRISSMQDVSYETDARGRIFITDLEKDTEYTLQQLTTAENYHLPATFFRFTVDEQGLINEEVQSSQVLTNRMIRTTFQVRDKLLHTPLSDYYVTLCDPSGQQIAAWTSSAVAENRNGLTTGLYYLQLNDNISSQTYIMIEDTADVQSFSCDVWTLQSILLSIALGVVIVAVPIGIILLIRTIRRKKR